MPDSQPVRVVFLNPWDQVIGPNRYLVEMLRHQPQLAAQSLVVFNVDHGGRQEFHDLGCQTGVWPEIGLVHAGLGPRKILRLAGLHSFGLARLVRRLRPLRPKLLVSNTEILWLGGMASRLLGIPHAQVFHAMTVFDRLGKRPWQLRAYVRFLALWSQTFIAVSQAQTLVLQQTGIPASRIYRIPNPIPLRDLELQAQAKAPPLPPQLETAANAKNAKILCCAGRISPVKGQDLLVEAVAKVRQQRDDVYCLFAGQVGYGGDGDEVEIFYRELQQRIDQLGLREHVFFLGEISYLPALLKQASLYVQPSRSESFGRVVAEAQVLGTPVVAFDVGGIPEVVGPGSSLVQAGDVGALAQSIEKYLADPPTDLTEGREHVRKAFDAPRVAEQFRELLNRLLGPRSPS